MEYLVTCEPTPNPQSMKFVLSKPIHGENFEADSLQTAKRSPLASKILGFPWAKSVFLGENFLTITKEEWVEWDILNEPLLKPYQRASGNGGKSAPA